MQFKTEFNQKIIFYFSNYSFKKYFVLMNYDNIIHITSTVPAAKLAFNEMIKIIKINISKKLRSQIANRQSAIFFGEKQAF